MGWEILEVRISTRLSRHNSEEDEEHDDLYNDLIERIQALCGEAKYAPINPSII